MSIRISQSAGRPFAVALLTFPLLTPACQPQPLPDRVAAATAIAECRPPQTDRVPIARMAASAPPVSAAERSMAMQLVAIFENGTRDLQYDYTERHDDGRGYTVGSVGFTTGTGDALEVIRQYAWLAERSSSPAPQTTSSLAALSAFIPELERLNALDPGDAGRAEVGRLRGFTNAWRAAAGDPLFRAAQDSISDRLYYTPAVRYALAMGLDSPLARAALVDAIIQHGGGDDPDGLPAMLGLTREEKGEPGTVRQEIEWLRRFLEIREQDLTCAHNADTREVWAESVARVSVYQQLLEGGNISMTPPLFFDLYGERWRVEPR